MDNWKKSSLLATARTVGFIAVGYSLCGQAHAQEQLLRITSPPNGTIVHPGQTITVVVTPAPGAKFQMVAILGEYPIGADPEVASAAPFKFSLTISKTIAAARKYRISASAVIRPGEGVDSAPITLDVEPASAIVTLRVDPAQITFDHVGDKIPINVRGAFADGSNLDLTGSSFVRYRSNDARIARVNKNGIVTPVGTGTTSATEVVVRFGGKTVSVPVSTIRLSHRISQSEKQ